MKELHLHEGVIITEDEEGNEGNIKIIPLVKWLF